jgi:hypothetical protein
MEYLGLVAGYATTSAVTTGLILKNELTPSLLRIIGQMVIIGLGIAVFTVVFNMIRALRTCEEENGQKSKGFISGLELSLFAIAVGLIVFVLTYMTGMIPTIINILLPFLSNYMEIVRGLVVAGSAFGGYLIGRGFIKIC